MPSTLKPLATLLPYSLLSPSLSAGINYRGQQGDNTRIHAANFNLTWLF